MYDIVSLVIVLLAPLSYGLPVGADNPPRPGFSSNCRGQQSVYKMAKEAEVVVEAVVVEVSPPRNNIYAVTLQVKTVMKDNGKEATLPGRKLQLLFIKPQQTVPELRSLPSARYYLEACIYEIDLKVGKLYHLFLAGQPGTLTGKAALARYVMTAPPLLASSKSRRRIEAGISSNIVKQPVIKSLELKQSASGKRMRLVCRTKRNPNTSIVWRMNGRRITEAGPKYTIRQKRNKSVLVVSEVRLTDSGVYSCTAISPIGRDTRRCRVSVQPRTDPSHLAVPTTLPSSITSPAYSGQTSSSSRPAITSTTTSTTTTSTTTTTSSTTTGVYPEDKLPCPIQGYCLNGGTCSFIPWMGELSCACAPGYQGARCDRKTTSALYSTLSMANTLCLFGIANPYHSC